MARQTVDHYIPFFGRDFYASTAMWTAEEVGHYMRLLIIQWDAGSLPADLARLELVSPGVGKVWDLLVEKFPLGEDGLRRNHRMEEHRIKASELQAARSEAGRQGAEKRWSDGKRIANASQTDGKPMAKPLANGMANGMAKTSPPSPSPSPSPNTTPTASQNEENSHTHTACGDDFRQPGWAADEWERFVAVWNQTGRAARWAPLIAPSAWVDYAASPGWQQRAYAALERLPGCEFFQTPLAVTKFFEFVDRILAGEFDTAKQDGRRARQRTGGNL
jgi:uncharacterized protein YdaU (DUF1376 family)